MQYRTDIISGNKLSVLGFGCMRFPRGITGIDIRKTEEIILRAIENGVNYFDTAWIYPGSEEVLGTVLDKNKLREKVYLATKLPLVTINSPDFDRYFNQSLKRLKTDYIDYYLMHMITDIDQWNRFISWGIDEWINEKKKSGQIRQIGFSFHGSCTEFLKIVDAYHWEFCQIQYNYSDENFQAGVTGLKKAAEKMPVIIMEPLLGGKLVKGLPKEAAEIFKKANPNLSPAAWALNWVWNQEEVTLLLSGMNDNAQVEENLLLAENAKTGMLSNADLNTYQQVLAVLNKACKIRCTGCNYCMPCPKNVNIPGCFSAYNASYSIGFVEGAKQLLSSTGFTSQKSSSPSLCVKCGLCEKKCPQNLPVMQHLTQVRRRLEPFWVKFICACARVYFGQKRKKKSIE